MLRLAAALARTRIWAPALAGGLALAAAPAEAQLGDLYGRAWLRVDAPAEGEVRVDLPLVEVSGLAGARGLRGEDVVLAVDVSDSTLEPCGIDLDGDGEEGATSPELLSWLRQQPDVPDRILDRAERWDLDDSVLMAELAAANAIVDQVDTSAFRVGVVAFSGRAWVAAPVGSSRDELAEALDHLRWYFFYELGGTDFAGAVRAATAALAPARAGAAPLDVRGAARRKGAPGASGAARTDGSDARPRSALFLSDGAISGGRAAWEVEGEVLAAARDAAAAGVRVFAYALGPQAPQELDVYRGMAELAGGRFEKLDRPADAVARLRAVDFAEVADLRIENATTGSEARALRSFPDGSFDALVELAPGANLLRFRARARNGSAASAERVVRYERPAGLAAEEEAQRLAELAEELRERTAETRLLREMAKRRPPQRREITVRAAGRWPAQPHAPETASPPEAAPRAVPPPVEPAPAASSPHPPAPGAAPPVASGPADPPTRRRADRSHATGARLGARRRRTGSLKPRPRRPTRVGGRLA